MLTEYLVLLATVSAAIGVELNVRRDRRCFHLWLFSNGVQVGFAVWLFAATAHKGALCNAALFGYYWFQALRGLRRWRTVPRDVTRTSRARCGSGAKGDGPCGSSTRTN